jgi:hypothetical protein
VFDPDQPETGYGTLMHVNDGPDDLSDSGREHEWGGEYGPSLIDRYTRARCRTVGRRRTSSCPPGTRTTSR